MERQVSAKCQMFWNHPFSVGLLYLIDKSRVMKFEKTMGIYFSKLEGYSEEQFAEKPNDESWSLGQVYVHTILANDHFFLKQAERCLNKEDTQRGKSKNNGGRVLFLINGFPNIKFKMPKSVEVPPRQPDNISSIREKLQRSLEQARIVEGGLGSFDKDEKVKHPAFGFMNAQEWYRMSEMHFRHHLRQLKRIEKLIGA